MYYETSVNVGSQEHHAVIEVCIAEYAADRSVGFEAYSEIESLEVLEFNGTPRKQSENWEELDNLVLTLIDQVDIICEAGNAHEGAEEYALELRYENRRDAGFCN
jgi:hypothetical protein